MIIHLLWKSESQIVGEQSDAYTNWMNSSIHHCQSYISSFESSGDW